MNSNRIFSPRFRPLLMGLVSFSLLLSVVSMPFARAQERPNVILIMTDDQGYGDLSRNGNPILETPNLDQLAEESIRLVDFHVAPSCTPTRSQLLSGLDALRNGAFSPHGQRHVIKRGIKTMGDVFLDNGYRTALYGKWHLGGNFHDFMPHERGFEDAVYFLRGGVQSHPNYWNSDLMDDMLYHNGSLRRYPGYATDLWFELSEAFVRECKAKSEPFFLYLPLNAPHGPYMVPDEFREPYKKLDKVRATFFGMIVTVDRRMAEFLKMLENEGLRDNTILIFLTDNGTAEGHLVYNAGMKGKKGSLYEGGHRVPCFISWPGGNLREPGDLDELTHCQDLFPTLIELCGLTPPVDVAFDGVSLVPLLRGEAQPALEERKLVVQRYETKGRGTIMWRKWRMVGDELYNIADDPGQDSNIADQHPDIVEELQEHYDAWWSDGESELELEPYRIGVDNEPVKLTAYDWWDGPRVYNWPHLRKGNMSTGVYRLVVDSEGEYRVSLRRWPRESNLGIRESAPRYIPFDPYMVGDLEIENFPPGVAINVSMARVRFGDQEQSGSVDANDQEVSFTFNLPRGETKLQTWFTTEEGKEFGAYYVYLEKI